MAVRFIIGRAGTGKTHYCLESIRSRLRGNAVDGPRLILLVPEQAALQMERAILTPGDIGGAHRADVLSFRRLAFKVLETAGSPDRRALSETARSMILRHLVAQRSPDLRYYRRVERLGGFLERLSETMTEFIEEAVAPSDLEVTDGLEPVQAAKLHDLRLIYQAYLDYLGTERLDPSQHLEAAREHLGRCGWLDDAEVWVDGFASLSRQETLTLVALAKRARHLDITMLADADVCTGTAAPQDDPAAAQLFRRTVETYGDLRSVLMDAGLEIEEPLCLRHARPHRFRNSPSLAQIERVLFEDAETEASAAPTSVELVELPSRRLEVEYALSRICRWIQDPTNTWRFRDLAIIARDLDPYHDLLSEALRARGIPFFIDRRRPTVHHPLVELLRSGTAMAADPLSLESVRHALKTGLVPISTEVSDELENHLIAHGLSGRADWQTADWAHRTRSSFVAANEEPTGAEAARLARINHARRAFLSHVEPWLTFAEDPAGHSGAEWSEGIIDWLQRLDAGSSLARWTQEAEGRGDLDAAAEHRQVWRDVLDLLDDLAFAFADVRLPASDLAAVLDAGLAKLTLGLAPPMVDQLLVGSIERSRHPDIKAAVILGFNDGVFPSQIVEDSILNDDDRQVLRTRGLSVAPPARERVLDEALLLYITLTRASHALVITHAAADNNGKVLLLSPYESVLRRALPGLQPQIQGDPIRLREYWDVLSPRDVTHRLVMEFRNRPALERDDPSVRRRWNELYDVSRSSLARDRIARLAFGSLAGRAVAKLSRDSVARIAGETLRASVSRLETYATCPFQYFAKYILSLKEREEATLEPVDVGSVHHAILDDFSSSLANAGQRPAELDEAALLQRLDESCGRIATRLPPGGTISNARNAYMLRRTRAQLARVVRAQKDLSACGTARPKANELPFGFNREGSLPALRLTTPAGRQVELRGYIDRVDLAELGDELLGIVVDYKRTRDKRLDLSQVYHGLSLQLLGYLLALAEHGVSLAGRPVRPIAGLYVSLAAQLHKVDHPDEVSDKETRLKGTFAPRGFFLAETFTALDAATNTGRSPWYNFQRKKDGEIGNIDSSDAADGGSFQAMLDHTRLRLGELADGILDGYIDVKPYRLGTFSPCSWCSMSAVCRFEMGISDVRFLEALKRSDVFKRVIEKPTKGAPE